MRAVPPHQHNNNMHIITSITSFPFNINKEPISTHSLMLSCFCNIAKRVSDLQGHRMAKVAPQKKLLKKIAVQHCSASKAKQRQAGLQSAAMHRVPRFSHERYARGCTAERASWDDNGVASDRIFPSARMAS